MYRVYVDNKELSLPPNACQTLSDIIKVVKTDYLKDNTLIQRLYVDDNSFFEMDPESLRSALSDQGRLETAHQIKIFTNSPYQVASETVEDVIAYIRNLVSGMEKISESLRVGNSERAFTLYTLALEGMYWVTELLVTLEKVFHLDYSIEVLDQSSVQSHVQVMTQQLHSLVEAQEKGDWILMADILEYELIETFRTWGVIFSRIRDVIKDQESKH